MIKHALEALRSIARHHALKAFSPVLIQMKLFMNVANSLCCTSLYAVLICYKCAYIYDNAHIYYYLLLLLVFKIVPRKGE